MSLASAVTRKLPGLAGRHPQTNEIIYLKGVVESSDWGLTGPTTQTIRTEAYYAGTRGYIKLIGETYAYFCDNCQATIWDQELQMLQGIGRSSKRTGQTCPFCSAPILPFPVGMKVRCHYRFSPKGDWGSWWAERWEW